MRKGLILVLLVCAGIAVYGDEFSAEQVRFPSSARWAVDVALSRFGTYVALADHTDGTSVRVLDENWELLWRHRQANWQVPSNVDASILKFAPDESFLMFPGYRTENDIALVNPRTGDPIAVLTDHAGIVQCLALSPDGSRLVSSAASPDALEVFLWLRSGSSYKVVDKLADQQDGVAAASITFAPDGDLVAMSQNEFGGPLRRIIIYRVSENRLEAVQKFESQDNHLDREYGQIAFSPDGRWLAAGYANSLKVFQRSGDSFRLAQTVPDIELGFVHSVTFSPDSTLLLTGHQNDIRAWRRVEERWQPEATFSPHHGTVCDMKFSLDGTKLAIAGLSETTPLGLWAVKGAGSSPMGTLLSLLQGRVSKAQKRFLDDALARHIISGLTVADAAPRDMFETEQEYAARQGRARMQAEGLLQEETEKHFSAERAPFSGGLYAVSVPLQSQGSYVVDTHTYTAQFMDTEATLKLERDPARELYQNWQKARVRAVRQDTPDGKTYSDFRLVLPVSGLLVPLGLSENPFTGEKLDRYGTHVPSFAIGPDLTIRNLSVEGISPAIYRYYAEHSIGQVTLQNTGSNTITGLSVRLFIPGLMKTPTDAQISPAIGVGQSLHVDIRALFDPSVLDRSEGTSVSAELTVEYSSEGKTYSQVLPLPIGILNRNAMRWTDDRKVGAFMIINDPAFLRFSGQVTGMADVATTAVLTRNFVSAVRLFSALRAVGLRYVVNPLSPYETLSRDSTAVDFVRFPVETLDAKSGDCSDLSVLYDSLLESTGVDTAYITTPGHIFTAFNLGMTAEQAVRVFGKTDDLITKDGVAWVPIETTMVDQGFMKAWQEAAAEWRQASAGQTAGFFTTKEAWKLYAPAGYVSVQTSAMPERDQVAEFFNTELDSFRATAIAPREKELLSQLESAPSPVKENQLGVLYAQFGLLSKAVERFENAISSQEYIPAIVNAANVCVLQQDYGRALEYLKRAQKKEPDNPRVLIALAQCLLQSGNEAEAKSIYERMSKIDPVLASRYPLAGPAAPAGQARAAQEGEAPALFRGDWVE